MADAAARGWIVAAALSGALSVAVGAFAAHGLDLRSEAGLKAREWLQTGSLYAMIHALAMLGTAALCSSGRLSKRLAVAAQGLFLAGSVLFPGALYALAFAAPRWLGAVAPVGGLAFIAGWIFMALSALRGPR